MNARNAVLVVMAQTNVLNSATSPKNEKDLEAVDIGINKFELLRLSFFIFYFF